MFGLKQAAFKKVVFCLVVRGFTLPTPLVVQPLKKNFFYVCRPLQECSFYTISSWNDFMKWLTLQREFLINMLCFTINLQL